MEELDWTTLYLYTQEASDQFIERVTNLAESNPNLSYKDFNDFDLIHPGKHASIDKFLEDYSVPEGSTCFEIGFGYGGTSRYLVCERGMNLSGIDFLNNLVEASLHANKVLSISNLKQEQGDILTYPIREGYFDFVFAITVFMHIDNKLGMLNAIRSLKPGGLLFIEDYFLLKKPEEYTPYDQLLLEERHIYGDKTLQTFRDLLEENGMEVLEFSPWKRWSEEAWDRAEKIINGTRDGTINLAKEFYYQYVEVSTKVSCDMDHYSPDELRSRYPNLCRDYQGEEIVYRRPKITNVYRVVARKRHNE